MTKASFEEWTAGIRIRSAAFADRDFRPDALLAKTRSAEVPGLLHVTACGAPLVTAPMSASLPSLPESGPYLLLLYLSAGSLSVSSGRTACTCSPGSSLLLPSGIRILLEARVLPCSFSLYLLAGDSLSIYLKKLPLAVLLPASPVTDHLLSSLDGLLSARETAKTPFLIHQVLTDLLTEWIPEPGGTSVPEGWLSRLHTRIHRQYQEPFSLGEAEQLLGVPRFRICRTYREVYGIPPLRDLNSVRIAEAKKLLLTTDLTIQEVSSSVGIDNCTHFISLFRKDCGITPGAFRRKSRSR